MRNIWSPQSFQGAAKRRRYFEGWYFKQSGGPIEGVWSFIPGIALGDSPEHSHSFVQVIEGKTGKSWWFEYPHDSFWASESGLQIRVGGNTFSQEGLSVDLDNGVSRISGSFTFGALTTIKFPPWSPGVMGPFSFIPGMECNHGLVSLDHTIRGGIEIDGRKVVIDDGRGYIEKDWGTSMPESWIWMQSNDFSRRGDSVMLSVAKIPWMGSFFVGFLCVASLNGEKKVFASYNRSRIEALSADDSKVGCTIFRKLGREIEERIEFRATRSRGGILRAPVAGSMSRRISEAVDATIQVTLKRGGSKIYEAESPLAGLETAGNVEDMIAAYQSKVK
jgi:hypothetical protein